MYQCVVCDVKVHSDTWCPFHPYDGVVPIMETKTAGDVHAPPRRMANGATTRDVDEYLNSWHDLAEPIETALGWKLVAFNPGLVFEATTGAVITRIDLPTHVVRDMNAKLRRLYQDGVKVGSDAAGLAS